MSMWCLLFQLLSRSDGFPCDVGLHFFLFFFLERTDSYPWFKMHVVHPIYLNYYVLFEVHVIGTVVFSNCLLFSLLCLYMDTHLMRAEFLCEFLLLRMQSPSLLLMVLFCPLNSLRLLMFCKMMLFCRTILRSRMEFSFRHSLTYIVKSEYWCTTVMQA